MIGHNSAPRREGEGWIALHRSVIKHPIVGFGHPVKPHDPRRGSFSRAEAWIWLITEASFADRTFHGKDYTINLERGQLVGGRQHLAEVWNWSEKTVRGFLSKLQAELMITLATDEIRANRRANTPQIITLCKYLDYQLAKLDEGPTEGPTKGQQRANEGPTKGQIDNNDNNYNNVSVSYPPTPQLAPGGGDEAKELAIKEAVDRAVREAAERAEREAEERKQEAKKARAEKAAKTKAENEAVAQDAADLVAAYNARAVEQGWSVCEVVTPQRAKRLLKRVEEIGGRQAFERALDAVKLDDFLSGRRPGRDGSLFKLDIDRLLSDQSGLGDVLARLLEKSSAPAAEPTPVNGRSWGWWRGKEETLRGYPIDRWDGAIRDARPNGTWPWWMLGAPPGHPECLVPDVLVKRYGYAEIYRGSINHA